jgi:hypothetical protein
MITAGYSLSLRIFEDPADSSLGVPVLTFRYTGGGIGDSGTWITHLSRNMATEWPAATGYNLVAIPVAMGIFVPWGITSRWQSAPSR